MDIKTKFNIGDNVFTIDASTMKIKEFTIKRLFISIHKEKTTVSLYEDDTYTCTGYEEDKCFSTEKELLDFIKPENYAETL